VKLTHSSLGAFWDCNSCNWLVIYDLNLVIGHQLLRATTAGFREKSNLVTMVKPSTSLGTTWYYGRVRGISQTSYYNGVYKATNITFRGPHFVGF